MKNYTLAILMLMTSLANTTQAQYDYPNYSYNNSNDERYYYDNEFDWHWDVRVRISDGIQQGLITNYESNKLYRQLEDIERQEYNYQADGYYSGWEQQEIWDNVMYLNRRLGLELTDYDRTFYGFDAYGCNRQGFGRGFYRGGFDFFRFDKRGFGSTRIGYAPRTNYNGWFRNHNNHLAFEYCNNSPRRNNRQNDWQQSQNNRRGRDFDRNDSDRRRRDDYQNSSQNDRNQRTDRNNAPTENNGGWNRQAPNRGQDDKERPNNDNQRERGNSNRLLESGNKIGNDISVGSKPSDNQRIGGGNDKPSEGRPRRIN